MTIPYRRLAIQAVVFSLIMTIMLFSVEHDWAFGDSTVALVVDFLIWLVVGGLVSFFTWRAEGYLERKNAKWLSKRKKE
ncbi:hypothetical protein [Neolewinella persica]|uniref:hypothetical protein n=1 Tax=Neolewinella persica TaxID=70998 RepID=UPI0003716378|nr:hypothetical protein [Neolewinella persica]